jgi:hypothetical protein
MFLRFQTTGQIENTPELYEIYCIELPIYMAAINYKANLRALHPGFGCNSTDQSPCPSSIRVNVSFLL